MERLAKGFSVFEEKMDTNAFPSFWTKITKLQKGFPMPKYNIDTVTVAKIIVEVVLSGDIMRASYFQKSAASSISIKHEQHRNLLYWMHGG